MKDVSTPRKRFALRGLLLPLVLVAAFATVFLGPGAGTALAAPICTNDLQGADDEPGQKDLTLHCVDTAGSGPGTLTASYQYDDTGTNGSNTLNACLLFDNDNDGRANFAVCVTTGNDPAVLQATRVLTCDDTSNDHCLGAVAVSNPGTTCTVGQGTNPFNGDVDARVDCNVVLADFGGSATRYNTCSYPSETLTSDESDCITSAVSTTPVTFRSASAQKVGKGVHVRWQTASEARVLGYNVYVERNGKRVKLNAKLIRAKGPAGGSYLFKATVPKGKFWLQTVNTDGSRLWRFVRAI